MPNKLDIQRIPSGYDRRVKLTPQDKADIVDKWKGGASTHSLAKVYAVNKRSIQFILFPGRLALNYQLRLERGGSKKYYNKDKWRETMREHRAYKKKVLQLTEHSKG
jgi:hypothetical protein